MASGMGKLSSFNDCDNVCDGRFTYGSDKEYDLVSRETGALAEFEGNDCDFAGFGRAFLSLIASFASVESSSNWFDNLY